MSYAYLFDLACTVLAAAAWYFKPELGPWPLLLIAAGRLSRLLAGGRTAFRWTASHWPALLFLASAWLGMHIAYDQVTAAAKFWQIVAGLALYESLAAVPAGLRIAGRRVDPARVLLVALPAVIAGYFLVSNDWLRWTGKVTWLDPAARWLASWQPALQSHRPNPNVTAGALAAFLPLQIAGLAAFTARRSGSYRGLRLALAVFLVGLSLAALLLAAARAAWVALAVGCLAWWLLSKIPPAGKAAAQARSPTRASPGTAFQSCLPLALLAPAAPSIPAEILDRLALLHNSVDLALDYPFTGLGLGGFQMAYSTYVYLLHVGYIAHSHNLFLDVWLEQGLAGLIALAWFLLLAGRTGWRSLRAGRGQSMVRSLALPGLAALLVLALHGMVHDALYASRGVLFIFIPFGVLAQEQAILDETRNRQAGGKRATQFLVWTAVAAGLAMFLLLPGVRAGFQANLGALAQTQAELSVYQWPQWPIQDALRRSGNIDLQPAVARYRAALALNPGNATANRRLGQIALSLGQYDVARQYLERAYRVAPEQRATRQMLGEIYAGDGDPGRAAAMWQDIDLTAGQLDIRAWWYGHIGDAAASRGISAAWSVLEGK